MKAAKAFFAQRYYPMLGVGAIENAKRFCQAFEEVKQFLHPRVRMAELVSLSNQRKRFMRRGSEKSYSSDLIEGNEEEAYNDKQ